MTREVTVVHSQPAMGGHTLHRLSDERFSIWGVRRLRRRAERFEVVEAGAGVRGCAKVRGHAPTLEEALELVATLRPSTPAEILAPILADRRATDRHRERVEKLIRLAEPGARLWVLPGYGEDGPGHAATSEGLHCDGVIAILADGAAAVDCWSIGWRRDDGNEAHGLNVVLLEDARRAWWIVRDGRIVAGGPPIYEPARAAGLAMEFGGEARLGLGPDDPAVAPAHTVPSGADGNQDGAGAAVGDQGAVEDDSAAVTAVVARHESRVVVPQACACGCGRPVERVASGPPRLYATDACRAAVYRRRRAGLPVDLPRQANDHGRRRLAATQGA